MCVCVHVLEDEEGDNIKRQWLKSPVPKRTLMIQAYSNNPHSLPLPPLKGPGVFKTYLSSAGVMRRLWRLLAAPDPDWKGPPWG